MQKQVYEGQTVRYFEQGSQSGSSGRSAIGGDNSKGTLAFVDTVHQNNALDLTILSPQGIIQKSAVPEANWEPTEFSVQLNKAINA